MNTFINLTPHAINEMATGTTFAPSGTVARVNQTLTPAGDVAGVPTFRRDFGEVVDLPAPQPGTVYIVSALVADACPDRGDLVSPGELVRNDAGQPVGCRGFIVRG
jgi:hypothetical protein